MDVCEGDRERCTCVSGKPVSVGMFICVCVFILVSTKMLLCCIIIKVHQCVFLRSHTQ